MQHIINTETGMALDVEIVGRGEPLLLIQGMSCHGGMWGDAFVEPLAREYEVISYDHRGVGASSRADEPFTVADLADDAAALLEVLGRDSAHVLGISMGGMVAQELALRAPDRVRSLVLGCTTAGGPDAFAAPGPRRLLKAIGTGDAELATSVSFEVNASAEFAARPGEYDRFRAAVMSRRVPAPVILMQSAAAVAQDARAQLAQIDVPTVVVHGDADEMIFSSEGEKLAAGIPGAEFAHWPGVGHLFWWERPDEAASLVLQHLKSPSGGSPEGDSDLQVRLNSGE